MPGTRPPTRGSGARPPRRAGRPAGDAPDLRARLLDAAIACYVRGGIAATPLRAIAAEAGVTPALLHYYFGDRAQLQAAVVEERVLPAIEGVRMRMRPEEDDVAALVAGFVSGITEAIVRNPWLPSLWVREVLSEGGALRELLLTRVAPMLPRMMAQRFAQAQADGRLNPGLDPRLLVVSLVGLTLFPAAGAPIWRQVFGAQDLDAGRLRDHTLALLAGGIAPPGMPVDSTEDR